MKRLGFRASWRTPCFIDGGCGASDLWAHTNGAGDFVLLDELHPPWPVHECYAYRVPLVLSSSRNISASRDIEWNPDIRQTVHPVEPVTPDTLGRPAISIIGAVLDVEKGMLGTLRRSAHASTGTDKEIRDKLKGCNAYVRFVTGDQREYWAFLNTNEHRVNTTDTVAARLRVAHVLGTKVFKVTDLVVFTADDVRD